MTCANCVRHVQAALAALPGVRDVRVDLASGRANLEVEDSINIATLRATLEAEEYGIG